MQAAVLLLSSQKAATPPPESTAQASLWQVDDTHAPAVGGHLGLSVPTTGVFSGHRHGPKGGKLTFGRHT